MLSYGSQPVSDNCRRTIGNRRALNSASALAARSDHDAVKQQYSDCLNSVIDTAAQSLAGRTFTDSEGWQIANDMADSCSKRYYGPTTFADGEARKAIRKGLDDRVASYRQQAQAKAAANTALDAYAKCIGDASVALALASSEPAETVVNATFGFCSQQRFEALNANVPRTTCGGLETVCEDAAIRLHAHYLSGLNLDAPIIGFARPRGSKSTSRE